MSVTFANVTDITIPQGAVTKITDSNGTVLWQKGLAIPQAHWETISLPEQDSNGIQYLTSMKTFVDTGDGIEIFKRIGKARFKYNSDGTVGEIKEELYNFVSADIDPVSKIWVVSSGTKLLSNAWGWQDDAGGNGAINDCIWSPGLQRFCLLGRYSSGTVDLDGNTQLGTNLSNSSTEYVVSYSATTTSTYCYNHIWADSLQKFVCPSYTTNSVIAFSSNGLTWTKITCNLVGNFPDCPVGSGYTVKSFYRLVWMPTVNKFVGSCLVEAKDSGGNHESSKQYIVKSSDCVNWEYVGDKNVFPRLFSIVNFGLSGYPAYSPEKKVLVLVGYETSYITRDLENWVEVPFANDMVQTTSNQVRWSKSLNGFIRLTNSTISKLVIDN